MIPVLPLTKSALREMRHRENKKARFSAKTALTNGELEEAVKAFCERANAAMDEGNLEAAKVWILAANLLIARRDSAFAERAKK